MLIFTYVHLVNMIPHRHAEANNTLIAYLYDVLKGSSFILSYTTCTPSYSSSSHTRNALSLLMTTLDTTLQGFRGADVSVYKFLTTLGDKQKYVLHFRNLKLHLNLGIELKAIHRVPCFKLRQSMKPFIDFNTNKRKAAPTILKKMFTN